MPLRARTRHGEHLLPGPGTLMSRALAMGLPVASSCSGRGACARCLVLVLDGREGLSSIEGHESTTLQREGARPEARLACQTRVVDEAREMVITAGYW